MTSKIALVATFKMIADFRNKSAGGRHGPNPFGWRNGSLPPGSRIDPPVSPVSAYPFASCRRDPASCYHHLREYRALQPQ
jgi:hypothetical protein